LDALYRPVAGKPFVPEDLCFDMGTSVASALTAETVFEIIKCMSDVDMPARVRMGSKCEILRFLPHDAMLSAVYATAIPSVRLSVRPSVTRVDQSKTVEAKVTQFSLYSSPIPLVFDR